MIVTVGIRWNADSGADVVDGVHVFSTRDRAVTFAKAWIRGQTIELNTTLPTRKQRDPDAFNTSPDAIYDSHDEIGFLFTDKEVL